MAADVISCMAIALSLASLGLAYGNCQRAGRGAVFGTRTGPIDVGGVDLETGEIL